jgi:hypothetical protein
VRQIGYLFVLLVLIAGLWDYPVLLPLKLLVVFFHESSHALATVLTGGRVAEMVVVAQQGGHVMSLGGNRFITLSAGYLGSLAWGMVIYTIATVTHWDRMAMFILGLGIAAITLIFVSNGFALAFGLLTAIAMMLAARFLNRDVNDFLLRLIGLTSILYVVLDIYSDTIARSHLRSDARMLAEEFGGATLLWGGLWIAISVLAMLGCLYWSIKLSPPAEKLRIR